MNTTEAELIELIKSLEHDLRNARGALELRGMFVEMEPDPEDPEPYEERRRGLAQAAGEALSYVHAQLRDASEATLNLP